MAQLKWVFFCSFFIIIREKFTRTLQKTILQFRLVGLFLQQLLYKMFDSVNHDLKVNVHTK